MPRPSFEQVARHDVLGGLKYTVFVRGNAGSKPERSGGGVAAGPSYLAGLRMPNTSDSLEEQKRGQSGVFGTIY